VAFDQRRHFTAPGPNRPSCSELVRATQPQRALAGEPAALAVYVYLYEGGM
jgi:hypothetical protein